MTNSNLIKSPQAIEYMRKGGKLLARILQMLANKTVSGINGKELNDLAHRLIEETGAQPAFLGYQGYPATLCLSINEAIVHGIPGNQTIKAGDLVKLDLGLKINGWNLDAALTIGVGSISREEQRLVDTAQHALDAGIATIKAGIHLGDVQEAIGSIIQKSGFGLVTNLTGHGIGKNLHEFPSIPNYGRKETGIILEEGMTLCLEPMITLGSGDNYTAEDDWTIITTDHTKAAHFEHTILVTKNGAEILTET